MKLIHCVILLVVLSISAEAKIHLYSRALAEKYVADSLKRADSLRVADSIHVAEINRYKRTDTNTMIAKPSERKIRLYSRARVEKQVADSLKRLDSLRVADSVHVADSLLIARYQTADTVIRKEKIRKEKELEMYKPVAVDSSEIIFRDSVDIYSARTIKVDESSKYARQIDSLENRMDSICNSIHDNDPWFKNMKTFPISEKKRYMIFLLQNNYKDSAAILTCCNQLYQMYSSRVDLLVAIKKSQTHNTKNFVNYHIETVKGHLAELSDFIVALSPKMPYHLQRQRRSGL